MINNPMDVLAQFPVRKNKKQKQAFRDAVQFYAEGLGYSCTVEKGSMGAKNVIIGNPDTAEYLVTAHYDTPARLPFPNLITPQNALTFLLYQFVLVFVFVLGAIIPGVIVGIIANSPDLAGQVGLIVYWVLLFMMILGPANRNNANDNTSGVVTVLETAKAIPEDLRDKVCFVLFDLEEAGLIGSSSYRKKHKKATENQIILNLDCVGDGNEIVMFPTKKLMKNAEKMAVLRNMNEIRGEKCVILHEKGFCVYPSDQKNFPYGLGIAAFRRNKWVGLYCDKIHTNKDTVLEEENVSILRDRLIYLISGGAAE